MSTNFGNLLREYRRRRGISQKELAARIGYHPSYVNRLERGTRPPPRQYAPIHSMASALGLSQEETDALLIAAGLEPLHPSYIPAEVDTPRLRKIITALISLHRMPDITEKQIAYVEDTILLLLAGFSRALPTAEWLPAPETIPQPLSVAAVDERETLLDDLLNTAISGSHEYDHEYDVGNLFAVLEEVVRGDNWELKRRIAEALPALLQADLAHALPLMRLLRADPPHPEWRTDIRRRVIEATPALYKLDPDAVPPLLRWHEGDEVYAALATLEALEIIGDERLREQLRDEVLAHVPPEQEEAVRFYVELLTATRTAPDTALALIEKAKDRERLIKMCITRCLARLLPTRPAAALSYMRYFLRRVGGVPAEHQNVRRPLSRDLPQMIAALDGAHHTQVEEIIRALAQDEDVHIRRALSDTLLTLSQSHPPLALDLIRSHLIQDPDRYVRERTWKTLPRLATLYPDEVRESCLALFR